MCIRDRFLENNAHTVPLLEPVLNDPIDIFFEGFISTITKKRRHIDFILEKVLMIVVTERKFRNFFALNRYLDKEWVQTWLMSFIRHQPDLPHPTLRLEIKRTPIHSDWTWKRGGGSIHLQAICADAPPISRIPTVGWRFGAIVTEWPSVLETGSRKIIWSLHTKQSFESYLFRCYSVEIDREHSWWQSSCKCLPVYRESPECVFFRFEIDNLERCRWINLRESSLVVWRTKHNDDNLPFSAVTLLVGQ